MTSENVLLPATYTIYLLISGAMTIWVARTLFRHGRPFLVDAFRGNEVIADSHVIRCSGLRAMAHETPNFLRIF